MSAEAYLYAQAEAWLRDRRHFIAQHLEEAMSHLTDLINNGKKLAAERADLITDRDSQKARADAAESKAADLQAKIDADDKTAADASDALAAEIAKEAGVSGSTGGSDTATPVTTTAPSGATVTVDPTAGTTTHVDPVTSTTTTVDHETGTATAADASGAAVEPAPAAVAEATAATTASGVDVPAAS
ncbi:MAG: hypothetical protein ACRYGP_28370 [Janthinobacterium lividum]